jgi:hypothetical protein
MRLRDVSAGCEKRAHALDMAFPARTDQRRPAIRSSLCDVSASIEERAHALDMALTARSQQ